MIETAIAARIGTLADGRVYPEVAPADAASPCITWTLISGGAGWTLAGWDGSIDAQIQIDAWALSKREAIILAEQAFDLMSASGPDFCVSEAARLPDDYESSTHVFRVSWEYKLQL